MELLDVLGVRFSGLHAIPYWGEFRNLSGDLLLLEIVCAALGAGWLARYAQQTSAGEFFLNALALCLGAAVTNWLALGVPLQTGAILRASLLYSALGMTVVGLLIAWLGQRKSPGRTMDRLRDLR
jgi:uncharacterized membrane protein YeaQ/YmgE (transglycosylase-associated protein family)